MQPVLHTWEQTPQPMQIVGSILAFFLSSSKLRPGHPKVLKHSLQPTHFDSSTLYGMGRLGLILRMASVAQIRLLPTMAPPSVCSILLKAASVALVSYASVTSMWSTPTALAIASIETLLVGSP